MASEIPRFDIVLHPDPRQTTVKLNGHDVTNGMVSIQISKPSWADMPVVVLGCTGEVNIEGTGAAFLHGNEEARELLDMIDPSELEAEAIRRTPAGSSLGGSMLAIIKERLYGSES